MKRMTWCAGWVLCGASLALAAPPPEEAPPASNEDFVKTASAAGLAEVNLARLALDQTSNADVRAFAQHMLDDHTKANAELLKIADKDQFAPAMRMDAKDQQMFTKLASLKGADFDREYIASQLADHKEAVALFQSEAKNGKNDDLKAFAEKTLPVLQHHLEMVQKVSDAEKTGKDKDKTDKEK